MAVQRHGNRPLTAATHNHYGHPLASDAAAASVSAQQASCLQRAPRARCWRRDTPNADVTRRALGTALRVKHAGIGRMRGARPGGPQAPAPGCEECLLVATSLAPRSRATVCLSSDRSA